jgi:predicted nucleic acid-binding protein
MKTICADTCFFIALYDARDQYHKEAGAHFVDLFANGTNQLLVAWPVVYETFCTRMTRNRVALAKLQRDWNHLTSERRLQLLPDDPFRDGVIDECFRELRVLDHYRALSAGDRVIRRMISDRNVRIDALVTFNARDFADVCRRFGRQMYPHA